MTVVASSDPLKVLFDIIFPFEMQARSRKPFADRTGSDAVPTWKIEGKSIGGDPDPTNRFSDVAFRAQVAFAPKLRTIRVETFERETNDALFEAKGPVAICRGGRG
jgi:hypothetical protein